MCSLILFVVCVQSLKSNGVLEISGDNGRDGDFHRVPVGKGAAHEALNTGSHVDL